MRHTLKFFLTLCFASFVLLSFSHFANGAFNLAFLEAEDTVPIEGESEYNWAKETYNATLIHPGGAGGKFEKDSGGATSLGNFQVVWWHMANANAIPNFFMDGATMGAFMDFVEGGGSLFLSQVAFHYVFDLGIETTEPRIPGIGADHAPTGIIAEPTQVDHPVFAGFDELGVDPEVGFNINCYGHDFMSDFHPSGPPEVGTVLGMAYQEPHPQGWFGQVTPLCEYKVGDGTIIISGWRFTAFRSVDEDCEFSDEMVKLHENIMGYLGTLAAVEPSGKLALTWGGIKE